MKTKDWELVAVLLVVLGFMGLMIKLAMAL